MIHQILGSPTRLRIILVLYKWGEMNMTELVKRVGVTQKAVFEQLEILLKYRVVESRQIGRVRLYRLSKDPLVRQLAEALAEADSALERF
ncbi:MAG: winged helix-turn-helix domain-containing protein [Pyrobaculum sp.]